MKRWILLLLIASIGLIATACGNSAAPAETQKPAKQPASAPVSAKVSAPAAAEFAPQTNDENSVTVEVTPLNITDTGMDVKLAFNTHSVPLDFDPTQIIVLRDANGTDIHPVSWDGSGPGGHHRKGTLHFELDSHPRQFIELVVHDVADIPARTFRWDLQ